MLFALLSTLSFAVNIVSNLLLAYIIFGFLLHFDIINRHNTLVNTIYSALSKLFMPILSYIRRFLPDTGSIDLSPVIVFLFLHFVQSVVFSAMLR